MPDWQLERPRRLPLTRPCQDLDLGTLSLGRGSRKEGQSHLNAYSIIRWLYTKCTYTVELQVFMLEYKNVACIKERRHFHIRSVVKNHICVFAVAIYTNSPSITHYKQSHWGSNKKTLYLPLSLFVHGTWFMQVRDWVNIPPGHRCELLTHAFCLTSAGLFKFSQGKEVFEWGMRGAWRRGGRCEGWSWQREVQWRRDRGGKSDWLWFEAKESQLHWEGTFLSNNIHLRVNLLILEHFDQLSRKLLCKYSVVIV